MRLRSVRDRHWSYFLLGRCGSSGNFRALPGKDAWEERVGWENVPLQVVSLDRPNILFNLTRFILPMIFCPYFRG